MNKIWDSDSDSWDSAELYTNAAKILRRKKAKLEQRRRTHPIVILDDPELRATVNRMLGIDIPIQEPITNTQVNANPTNLIKCEENIDDETPEAKKKKEDHKDGNLDLPDLTNLAKKSEGLVDTASQTDKVEKPKNRKRKFNRERRKTK